MSKLKSVRVYKGYTQEETAKILGVTSATYNRKETGKISFKLEECKKLSEVFGVSLDELFSE